MFEITKRTPKGDLIIGIDFLGSALKRVYTIYDRNELMMLIDNYVELFKQEIFLAGLLAGFAITIVVQLMAMGGRRRVKSVAILLYMTASAILIVTTVGFVYTLVSLSGPPPGVENPPDVGSTVELGVAMGFLLLLGLIVFLAGMGATGWVYSRSIGIGSTILSALSIVGIIAILLHLFLSTWQQQLSS